jgi:small-conductance mechanosensitive channel
MEKINEVLSYSFDIGKNVHIEIKDFLILIIALILTNVILRLVRRLVSRKLEEEDKGKFKAVFSFLKYFIYVAVITIALESLGVEISVLLAGSAALLVGLGLGLQTLFQDIISGIFILLDKSLHVNDVIEIENKIGKVFEIKLRTTRIVTIDDKVMVIPNHKFLTNSLFNWTQNGIETTEVIDVGVAYGSDVERVKNVMVEVAKNHPKVLTHKEPKVLLVDFGESALLFRLIFTINESFAQMKIKSDLRYEIVEKYRKNGISIPFPQRDIHMIPDK